MSKEDEPVFAEDAGNDDPPHDESAPLNETIGKLVASTRFGVLCTQGRGQPYGSVVAFAFSEDLATAAFATPRATRKHRLLSECERVSLVIDNRPEFPDDMMQVEAVTVTPTHRTRRDQGPGMSRPPSAIGTANIGAPVYLQPLAKPAMTPASTNHRIGLRSVPGASLDSPSRRKGASPRTAAAKAVVPKNRSPCSTKASPDR